MFSLCLSPASTPTPNFSPLEFTHLFTVEGSVCPGAAQFIFQLGVYL